LSMISYDMYRNGNFGLVGLLASYDIILPFPTNIMRSWAQYVFSGASLNLSDLVPPQCHTLPPDPSTRGGSWGHFWLF